MMRDLSAQHGHGHSRAERPKDGPRTAAVLAVVLLVSLILVLAVSWTPDLADTVPDRTFAT